MKKQTTIKHVNHKGVRIPVFVPESVKSRRFTNLDVSASGLFRAGLLVTSLLASGLIAWMYMG